MSDELIRIADVLAESALARRITWAEADRTLRQLEAAQEQTEAETLSEEQREHLLRAVCRVQEILARIKEPEERRFWKQQAPEILADLSPNCWSDTEWKQIQPAAPAWWGGAKAEEILAFDLYPGGPEGTDLPELPNGELQRRLAAAAQLLTGPASRWLLFDYSRRLEGERRRREGAA